MNVKKDLSAKSQISKSTRSSQLPKVNPISQSLFITFGGLTLSSTLAWAEEQQKFNEIWIKPGDLKGICSKDIDRDGDLDVFAIYPNVVMKIENVGNLSSPQFTAPKKFLSNQNNLILGREGITDCTMFTQETTALIDIDDDGDLDLFTGSSAKFGGVLNFSRNVGTTENPEYVNEDPQTFFRLPANVSNFMFKDVDGDGDVDFWSDLDYINATFYENTGTPEHATFVQRNESPIAPLRKIETVSQNGLGYLIDLNNDQQWDMLVKAENNQIAYIESSPTGYQPRTNLVGTDQSDSFQSIQALDIDNDNDIDILGKSEESLVLYTNISSDPTPEYDIGQIFPFSSTINFASFSDFNGDNHLDFIYKLNGEDNINLAINTGNNLSPQFDMNRPSVQLEQCNNSIHLIASHSTNPSLPPPSQSNFFIEKVTQVDIDADNDLDLFLFVSIYNSSSNQTILFCENIGDNINPLFSEAIKNPFGLNNHQNFRFFNLSFGDIDGDGDQDAWQDEVFFDNVGSASEPLFQTRSVSPTFADRESFLVTDTNQDGQIDSVISGSGFSDIRLLHNVLEPANKIVATVSNGNDLFIATARSSHVQLQRCDATGHRKACTKSIFIPLATKDLSISSGDFNGNGHRDVVIAMIDSGGVIKIQLYDSGLKLIGSQEGERATSISLAAGQLDADRQDEYVISMIQPDNNIVAKTYNLDGSLIGTADVGSGKQTSIDVGKFASTEDTYVVAYISADDQLNTATFHSNGTLITQGKRGAANYVKVSKASFSESGQDDYVTSLIQTDGRAALIGFSSNGTRLGKVTGNQSLQPQVMPGHFPGANSKGLAVSLIQSDKKPAIIFLDNQGQYIARGIGGINATSVTSVLIPQSSSDVDEGVLVYNDEAGIVRWQVFDYTGAKR